MPPKRSKKKNRKRRPDRPDGNESQASPAAMGGGRPNVSAAAAAARMDESGDLVFGDGADAVAEFGSVQASKRGRLVDGSPVRNVEVADDMELEFEDPYEDVVDPDDMDLQDRELEDDMDVDDEEMDAAGVAAEEEEALEEDPYTGSHVWRPGQDPIAEGEKLDYDPSVYTTFHQLRADWPCLSFDLVRDHLGEFRTRFPQSLYMVSGTQASRADKNKVMVSKLSELHRTKHDMNVEGAIDSDEEDDDLDDDPILEHRSFPHMGAVNRLRCLPQSPNIVATMSDTSEVRLFDCGELLKALDHPPMNRIPEPAPFFTFTGHSTEGYAIDWSRTSPGRLATGDCDKNIYLWNHANGSWAVEPGSYRGHTDSVEDIQWSPVDPNAFASCSVDRTIRVWDTRAKEQCVQWVAGHRLDVNVISWNRITTDFILSGSDDGSFKVWDRRKFVSSSPYAFFHWHKGPITSVEWHPTDETMFAVSSDDHTISIWDLAVEADPDERPRGAALQEETPSQLLFVHQGQQHIKEIHWHPQITSLLVSTSATGFHVFKPEDIDGDEPEAAGASSSSSSSAAAPSSRG